MVLFLQGHFFVRTLNLKANVHIVPFQFVKNSYFKCLQGSVATLLRWSWKFYGTLWLIYPRNCISISINQKSVKYC